MDPQEPTFTLEHEGRTYVLKASNFTALDDFEIWKITRIDLHSIFFSLVRGQASMWSIAALVWRERVNSGEPDLTFTDFAKTFRYTDVATVKEGDEGGGPPEAPDGGS